MVKHDAALHLQGLVWASNLHDVRHAIAQVIAAGHDLPLPRTRQLVLAKNADRAALLVHMTGSAATSVDSQAWSAFHLLAC